MRLQDAIGMSWRALTAHRLRSFLTLLGIAVGIAAVILLTSIGEGLHRFVLAEFTQFGTNVIGITPGKTMTGGANPGFPSSVRPLTLADALALRRVPQVLQVTPGVTGNAEVEGNGRLRRVMVYGTTPTLIDAFKLRIRSGQFLPLDDPDSARNFVVLGAKLQRELFGVASPLGARLRVGSMQFRVIGVLEARGQFLGIDLDDMAYIPAARALELFNRDGLMEINLSYAEGANANQVADAAKAVLAARHGREDFTLVTQADMLRTLSNILDVLTMAVAALGSISLLVGGVGIVTIMTIAVAERTAEIGLLVALGARRATVLRLFLGEAVVLSAAGGLLGLVIGITLAQALRLVVPALPVQTPPMFIVLAEGVALVIGLAAGVLPARRAARLDPVEALRAE
ncbi:ABC transporter permease [Aquincola sp. S2]|uniref:ABC transporter permease n=2 Tax=Pseudaquabacterium terrae TaxID=2732868 RepID=A0ABX2EEG8_9BURK|nr:ABC transporter permease [Aquabacterium terrae]